MSNNCHLGWDHFTFRACNRSGAETTKRHVVVLKGLQFAGKIKPDSVLTPNIPVALKDILLGPT
jgi:hypothetical protein